MTPEIEKRIKLVQAGKVPAGYKRTKIGIVPNEWSICSFDSLSCKTGRKKRPTEDFPVYSINNQKGFCSQAEQFENDGYSNTSKDSYTLVEKGDFAYNPARKNIGSIGLLKTQEKVVISSLYVCFKLNSSCNKEYFESYFKSHRFNYDVSNYTEGSVRQYLFYDNFAKISVAVPPKREQEKIAEILAAQDRVIELKEKLVEAKQRQKKCLMQQLLSGKKRLSGFGEDMCIVLLGNIAAIKGGKRLPKGMSLVTEKNEHPYITISDMKNGTVLLDKIQYVPDAAVDCIKRYRVNSGDIYITVAGTLGEVGLIPCSLDGANLTENADKIVDVKCDKMFLFHFLRSDFTKNQVISSQTNNAQPKLAIQQIEKFEINLPSLPEQQAIAKVLSAADEEISLLQKDLEQEKLKKKSLMQLLLTGLVRVVC